MPHRHAPATPAAWRCTRVHVTCTPANGGVDPTRNFFFFAGAEENFQPAQRRVLVLLITVRCSESSTDCKTRLIVTSVY